MSIFLLRAHFPQKSLWFNEKSTFLTQKTWFHTFPRLFSIPTILISKRWTKYNKTATAKFRRNSFSCLNNNPKLAVFGQFLIFLFLRSFFWELWTPSDSFLTKSWKINCYQYGKWHLCPISSHARPKTSANKVPRWFFCFVPL